MSQNLCRASLDIPDSGWDVVRLESLLLDQRGIAVGVMYPGEHDPSGIPLVRSGDLAGGRINSRPDFQITKEKHAEYKRTELSGGELLISLVGNVGLCAIVGPEMGGWNVARAVAVLRFTSPNDAYFVKYCLLSGPYQHLMRAWSTTTVQATLNLKEIRQIPLPWPKERHRSAVVTILKSIDDKVALNRRMNKTLEATVSAIFTDWFVDYGPTRAMMEGRTSSVPPALRSIFPELLDEDRKPQQWERRSLHDSFDVFSGGTPKTSVAEYWGGNIPWFSVVDTPEPSDIFVLNTQKHITETGLANCAANLLPAGVTIITARGTVGNLAITTLPTVINQSCYGISGRDHIGRYLTYFLVRQAVQALRANTHGSVFDTITRDTFKSVSAVIPSPTCATAFETAVQPAMERILANDQQNKVLISLRDLLLLRLISGELDLKDIKSSLVNAL